MFKPHPQEFFLSEMETLAASVGKAVDEVKFVVEEATEDGVAGHTLSIEGQTPAPVEVAEPVIQDSETPAPSL